MGKKNVVPGDGYSGSGTELNPWSPRRAFKDAKPGDEVLFRGGNYLSIPPKGNFVISASGRENAAVVFTNYPGEKVIFDGDKNTERSTSGGIRVSSDYIVFSGFEVKNFHYMSGMKIAGSHNQITKNFFLSNADHKRKCTDPPICGCGVFAANSSKRCGDGISFKHNTIDNRILDNVVWGSGMNKGFDHGIYVQGIDHLIAYNILAYSSGGGLNERIGGNNMFQNNTIFNSFAAGIIVNNYTDKESPFWENDKPLKPSSFINNIICGEKTSVAILNSGAIWGRNLIYNPNGWTKKAVDWGARPPGLIEEDPLFVDKPASVQDFVHYDLRSIAFPKMGAFPGETEPEPQEGDYDKGWEARRAYDTALIQQSYLDLMNKMKE